MDKLTKDELTTEELIVALRNAAAAQDGIALSILLAMAADRLAELREVAQRGQNVVDAFDRIAAEAEVLLHTMEGKETN